MIFQLLEAVWRDFRFGLILIRKTPLASALILITFALATGANIATFTFANAVLFRPMAYPNPDSLMWVTEVLHSSTSDEVTITADFLQWQAENTTFSGLGGYNYADRVLTLGDNTREVRTIRATAGLLPLLGVPPAMGRWFTTEEDQPHQNYRYNNKRSESRPVC